MRVIYNVKHRYAIRLKFGNKSLTSLTKLELKAIASICSTIKENLLLCLSQVVVVIMLHIFITRPVSRKNATCNRNHNLSNK